MRISRRSQRFSPPNKLAKNKSPAYALIWISISVLLSTSPWFTGTAATPLLSQLWELNDVQSAWLTISVQLGFIIGTFLYAWLNLADIFSARKVFFISALLGALGNGGFAIFSHDLGSAVFFRLLTGITLAGIYPVGMKIIAQWYRTNLGWRLGVLVGALTLGTASPYLFFALGADFNWRKLMLTASILSLIGGAIVLGAVAQGPYLTKTPRFNARMAWRIFKYRSFRLQAFGYFGHMWELYAFWSLTGTFLAAHFEKGTFSLSPPQSLSLSLPWLCFLVIGIGALGCIAGGWISRAVGEKSVALSSLIVSGTFCALSGFLFEIPSLLLVIVLLVWGLVVISDSPQFSALAALYCPQEYTGTALTIQNGIGFAITVISIQFTAWIAKYVGWQWAFLFLTIGPIAGIISLLRLDIRAEPGSTK